MRTEGGVGHSDGIQYEYRLVEHCGCGVYTMRIHEAFLKKECEIVSKKFRIGGVSWIASLCHDSAKWVVLQLRSPKPPSARVHWKGTFIDQNLGQQHRHWGESDFRTSDERFVVGASVPMFRSPNLGLLVDGWLQVRFDIRVKSKENERSQILTRPGFACYKWSFKNLFECCPFEMQSDRFSGCRLKWNLMLNPMGRRFYISGLGATLTCLNPKTLGFLSVDHLNVKLALVIRGSNSQHSLIRTGEFEVSEACKFCELVQAATLDELIGISSESDGWTTFQLFIAVNKPKLPTILKGLPDPVFVRVLIGARSEDQNQRAWVLNHPESLRRNPTWQYGFASTEPLTETQEQIKQDLESFAGSVDIWLCEWDDKRASCKLIERLDVLELAGLTLRDLCGHLCGGEANVTFYAESTLEYDPYDCPLAWSNTSLAVLEDGCESTNDTDQTPTEENQVLEITRNIQRETLAANLIAVVKIQEFTNKSDASLKASYRRCEDALTLVDSNLPDPVFMLVVGRDHRLSVRLTHRTTRLCQRIVGVDVKASDGVITQLEIEEICATNDEHEVVACLKPSDLRSEKFTHVSPSWGTPQEKYVILDIILHVAQESCASQILELKKQVFCTMVANRRSLLLRRLSRRAANRWRCAPQWMRDGAKGMAILADVAATSNGCLPFLLCIPRCIRQSSHLNFCCPSEIHNFDL